LKHSVPYTYDKYVDGPCSVWCSVVIYRRRRTVFAKLTVYDSCYNNAAALLFDIKNRASLITRTDIA